MNPPTEQLVRDYLNRVSVAARGKLGSAERREFLARMRESIERQTGPPGTAELIDVGKLLSGLGEPRVLVERERARLAQLRGVPDSAAARSSQQPGRPAAWMPRISARRRAEVVVPSDPGPASASEVPLAAEPRIQGRPVTARRRQGEPPQSRPSGPRRPSWTANGKEHPGKQRADVSAPEEPRGAPGRPAPETSPDEPGRRAPEEPPGEPGRPASWAMRGERILRSLPRLPRGGSAGGSGRLADGSGRLAHARAVLGRIARAAAALARDHPLEASAIVLLGLGGLIFPPIWLVGAFIALLSRDWDFRDKWVGVAGPVLLMIVGTGLLVARGGHKDTVQLYLREALMLADYLIRAGAVLGAAYLTWRTQRGPREPPVPPWNRPHRL